MERRRRQRRQAGGAALCRRLGVAGELRGHSGCVNRLWWEPRGRLLSSVSDDRRLGLWARPLLSRSAPEAEGGRLEGVAPAAMLETSHVANVFGVRLARDASFAATGGLDGLFTAFAVRPDGSRPREDALLCACGGAGRGRGGAVKEVVRLYDLRASRPCAAGGPCAAVMAAAVGVSAWSVAVSPREGSRLVAAACTLPGGGGPAGQVAAVRFFDARAAAGGTWEPAGAAAPLLSMRTSGLSHPTHVTFSEDGASVLANHLVDGVYRYAVPGGAAGGDQDGDDDDEAADEPYAPPELPPGPAAALKLRGNEAFLARDYSAAVALFRRASAAAGPHPVLLGNRAAALLRRGWAGDAEEAVQHAREALRLSGGRYAKARARLVQACRAAAAAYHPHSMRVRLRQAAAVYSEGGGGGAANPLGVADGVAEPSGRYAGHRALQTSIKEAREWGGAVLAGADNGALFAYDATGGELLRVVDGVDPDVLNSVAPHPCGEPLVCASGIASTIKVLEATGEPVSEAEHARDLEEVGEAQRRLAAALAAANDAGVL